MVSVHKAPVTVRLQVAVSYVLGRDEKPHKINAAYATAEINRDANSITFTPAIDVTSSFESPKCEKF